MRKLAILGSTGSIGTSTLDVVRNLGSDAVSVVALAAYSNIDLLEQQALEFRPDIIAVYDSSAAGELQQRLPTQRIVAGMEGVIAAATHDDADMVMSAMVGTMGLTPTVEAIRAGKDIALANKEALVSGGQLVMSLVQQHGVRLLPVDSEHSALFQCLNGEKSSHVGRLILTASGGPFRNHTADQLACVTIDDALAHPTWSMGPKITVDSSTLMNKGLEVIEAHWLFGIPVEQIDVVIHPQSVIHSMVEYIDGSMVAQMSRPTMLVPIQYALTYPERAQGLLEPFDFLKHHTLQFFQPDFDRFRCLSLAFQAIAAGGSYPCYLNAANEVLVKRFLDKEISWTAIPDTLATLLDRHQSICPDTLDTILAVDHQARSEAAHA